MKKSSCVLIFVLIALMNLKDIMARFINKWIVFQSFSDKYSRTRSLMQKSVGQLEFKLPVFIVSQSNGHKNSLPPIWMFYFCNFLWHCTSDWRKKQSAMWVTRPSFSLHSKDKEDAIFGSTRTSKAPSVTTPLPPSYKTSTLEVQSTQTTEGFDNPGEGPYKVIFW